MSLKNSYDKYRVRNGHCINTYYVRNSAIIEYRVVHVSYIKSL